MAAIVGAGKGRGGDSTVFFIVFWRLLSPVCE